MSTKPPLYANVSQQTTTVPDMSYLPVYLNYATAQHGTRNENENCHGFCAGVPQQSNYWRAKATTDVPDI